MLISKISSLFKKIILEEGMYGLFFRIKTRVYFIVYKAYKFIGLKKVPSAYGYNFHANYSDFCRLGRYSLVFGPKFVQKVELSVLFRF